MAALQAFRDSPRRFDVVLTDESMPELAGTALAGEISLLRLDLPIVLKSGELRPIVDSAGNLLPEFAAKIKAGVRRRRNRENSDSASFVQAPSNEYAV